MLTSTYSATWGLFNDALDVGDLAGAEALLSGAGKFAKTMKRLCLHSATGVHGLVPKSEPRRAVFKHDVPDRAVDGELATHGASHLRVATRADYLDEAAVEGGVVGDDDSGHREQQVTSFWLVT